MKKILTIVIVLSSLQTFGQFSDDFNDGDFISQVQWTPDNHANWAVAAGRLRSNSTTPGSSFYITTPSALVTDVRWEFLVELQFNTSSANYVDLYLISEQANLASSTNNGYFVRIGGTNDEVCLYKKSGSTITRLIDGADGITNASKIVIRVRVTRENNLWLLEHDITGGKAFHTEGTVIDNGVSTGGYFGIKIQQSTSSFFGKHYFDDIQVVSTKEPERDPPLLTSVAVTSQNSLTLTFNEAIDATTALAGNFLVAGSNTTSATLQADGKTLLLSFNPPFVNGAEQMLSVSGVRDLAGNEIEKVIMPFQFFVPSPPYSDAVIITEIMADPSPVVRLPEVEYIEIYNRSTSPYNFKGWTINDSKTTAKLPAVMLMPHEYAIMMSATASSKFPAAIKSIPVTGFPSLNNDGEPLVLKSENALTIDSIFFSLDWYRSDEKKEGGWSLELIDPENTCAEGDNWTASEDLRGGTPGEQNSVFSNKPDVTPPHLERLVIGNANLLNLYFNEKLQKSVGRESFHLAPSVEITSAAFTDQQLRSISLSLAAPLQRSVWYSVVVENLADCAGNYGQSETKSFLLPDSASVGDVLVNEVLFNPPPSGADFVEVYNSSSKYLDLKEWMLANVDGDTLKNARLITDASFLLEPKSFVVFTSDPNALINNHPNGNRAVFFRTNLPPLNDDQGSIAILSPGALMMDSFAYDESFHSSFIKEREGVSLERVSLSIPTQESSNWRSATAASGYATPGRENSNARPAEPFDANALVVEPPVIAPPSGFTLLKYSFEESGFAATVRIFDADGAMIREISNNELLGISGFLRWDGDDQEGRLVRSGLYIVWFQVTSADGWAKVFRKTVIVSASGG